MTPEKKTCLGMCDLASQQLPRRADPQPRRPAVLMVMVLPHYHIIEVTLFLYYLNFLFISICKSLFHPKSHLQVWHLSHNMFYLVKETHNMVSVFYLKISVLFVTITKSIFQQTLYPFCLNFYNLYIRIICMAFLNNCVHAQMQISIPKCDQSYLDIGELER